MIVGFLNNEPRYLEPLLAIFENGSRIATTDSEGASGVQISWEERYIILLWMSLLMLAPFDLASISSLTIGEELERNHSLKLPENLPTITLRVLPICIESLRGAARERTAAASLLTRMCLRPDMRQAGLLDTMVQWFLSQMKSSSDEPIDIHRSLGILTFLSKLVSSGNHEEVGRHVASILYLWHDVNDSQSLAFVRSSAVARKLNIKIIRSIVLLCLHAPVAALDSTTVVEEAIGYLLEVLADADSPVRLAASKAISVITLQLDARMAEEVVGAILGSLTEDVLWSGTTRNLTAVNPLRWHGLTLTLGHLLYKRAISTDKLPDLLNALVLALNFEQRSATGSAIGTNVRDAANFGIWALSRRYTTSELLQVDTAEVRAIRTPTAGLSILQILAIELIQSSCLDPAGNIRRGSSAALQELIGRHPNEIVQGISLVQTVDYHAVGLRERAMIDVAVSAAQLDQIYWDSIFDAIVGWRGIGAVDSESRIIAAKAIGKLSSTQTTKQLEEMVSEIERQLVELPSRQVEERQGLLVALSSLINNRISMLARGLANKALNDHSTIKDHPDDLSFLVKIWDFFFDLRIANGDFKSVAMRPELTATAVCDLLAALSRLSKARIELNRPESEQNRYYEARHILELCLQRSEESVAEKAANVVDYWISILSPTDRIATIDSWINTLTSISPTSNRKSGYPAALGAAFGSLDEDQSLQARIVKTLCDRCYDTVEIDTRVIALKSISRVCQSLVTTDHKTTQKVEWALVISQALDRSLNDYTINERGDVGSLVRLEALNTVDILWSKWDALDPLFRPDDTDFENDPITLSVVRLALERLDKVRNRATACLNTARGHILLLSSSINQTDRNTISYYKHDALYGHYVSGFSLLRNPSHIALSKSVILGLVSSAGMGSESVLRAARSAVIDCLSDLPDTGQPGELGIFECTSLLTAVLEENLSNDRIVLPLLDFLAFLLDMQIPQRLAASDFK